MYLKTVDTSNASKLRASEYCRRMDNHTYRAMIEFMDSRMSYLLSQGVTAYDAAITLYEEIRVRYALPVAKVNR